MLDIKRILFATDFPEIAQRALCYALELAVGFDARLDVIHVIQHNSHLESDHHTRTVPENIEVRLKETVQAQLEALHPGASLRREIHYMVQQGAGVGTSIGTYAERNDIDLVVLGTHRRSDVQRLLLGSVAEDVVRTAPCAVLTVPPHEDANGKALKIQRILVPIDFSAHARRALRIAKEAAGRLGAQLDLLHIIGPMARPEFYDAKLRWLPEGAMRLQPTVRQQLEAVYEQTEGPDVVGYAHAIKGNPADKIIEFAQANDAGLIVMAPRGLTGMQRLMLGSVTEWVLREAHCPVLVVKPSDKVPLTTEAATASFVSSLASIEHVREHAL